MTIAFQNKKHPKGIGEISDAFLMKIRSDRLTNPKKYCIIVCGYPHGTRFVLCGIAKNTFSGYFEVQNGVFKDM